MLSARWHWLVDARLRIICITMVPMNLFTHCNLHCNRNERLLFCENIDASAAMILIKNVCQLIIRENCGALQFEFCSVCRCGYLSG